MSILSGFSCARSTCSRVASGLITCQPRRPRLGHSISMPSFRPETGRSNILRRGLTGQAPTVAVGYACSPHCLPTEFVDLAPLLTAPVNPTACRVTGSVRRTVNSNTQPRKQPVNAGLLSVRHAACHCDRGLSIAPLPAYIQPLDDCFPDLSCGQLIWHVDCPAHANGTNTSALIPSVASSNFAAGRCRPTPEACQTTRCLRLPCISCFHRAPSLKCGRLLYLPQLL